MMRTWIILLLLAGLAAGATFTSAAASAGGPQVPFAHFRGVVRVGGIKPGVPGDGLSYHGGPVMRTNTSYAVYWQPPGYSYGTGYQSTIDSYFQNVAADSGKSTNVYASDTQYYDNNGPISYSAAFGGAYTDTDSFPASGCHDSYTSVCLTDAQIQAELNKFVAAKGLPSDLTHLYFLFTPKGVGSCFDSYSGQCAFTYYCAYHSNAGNTLYANMPYADTVPSACDSGESPNGNDADATLNVTSHEHNEAITDPLGTAWYRSGDGSENGDLCAWTFGAPLGSTQFGLYNQAISTGFYYLQQEWSNSDDACVLTYQIAPSQAPTVSGFSPTSGPVGTSVTVDGSGFTGTTGVTFAGTNASFTVDSDTQITATVPPGAQSGPIAVTNPAGTGTSAGSFNVTAPQPPTISGFSPTSGPIGTTVTITGSAFTGATQVTFNGTSSSYAVVSDTRITAKVPAGATTGPVSVSTPGGLTTSTSSFTVTIPSQPPVISSFTPTRGFAGTVVTIKGWHFSGATSVQLGTTGVSFTVVSDNTIKATVPSLRFGFYRWRVITPSGSTLSRSYFWFL